MRLEHTIGQILDFALAASPKALAVTLGDVTMTFGECNRRGNRMARALMRLGISRGDRLMYWSPISLAAIDVFVATQRLGAAFVPFKDSFLVHEANALVNYVQPKLLIADASLGDKAAAVAKATGVEMATIGGVGPGNDLDGLVNLATDSEIPDQHVEEEDIHAIFLTSGSTGQPKGVMISHRASWYRSFCGNGRWSTAGGRGDINMFPLFHWAGWHYLLCPWIHGRASHLTHGADAESLVGLIDRWHPSYMYAIPAVWERVLGHRKPFETRSLRWTGTGTYRVEPALIESLKAKFPRTYCTIGWGATEFGVGVQIDDDDIPRKPYSIGLPAPGNEIRLIDGELCGRSEQMMSGYYNLPGVTASVMKDGWYHSGDLAERDADGYYTITGRAREIIRSGAETIAPAEVEAAIAGCPGVVDVAVIGMPDASWGEVVCAAVIVSPGASLPTIDDIKGHLSSKLAPFKHPRRVIRITEIPRTPATGQIQRSAIKELILRAGSIYSEDAGSLNHRG